MTTKVRELDNRRQGDRGACAICSPKRGRITESQLWERRHLGWRPKTAAELARAARIGTALIETRLSADPQKTPLVVHNDDAARSTT